MARAGHSGTVVGSAIVVREKYYWPDLQLNLWTIVMLATAGTILGINAQFMAIQDRMGLGTPWYAQSATSDIVKMSRRENMCSRTIVLTSSLGSCPTVSQSAHWL